MIDTKTPLFIPEEEFTFRDGRRGWFQTVKIPLSMKGRSDCVLGIAVDITRLKQAEAALRESERLYRLIFEHAGVGIGYWTSDGRLISFNRLANKYLGGDDNDLTGRLCTEIFPGDLGRQTLERIQCAAVTPGFSTYENQIQLNGRTYWFLSTYAAVRRPDGSVAGVQIISQDLTEHRRAQSELGKQKSIFEAAEELADIGSWEWDTGTDNTYWSPQLYAIYGRDPLLGPPDAESWWDYVHPDDRQRVRDELSEAAGREGGHDTTFRIIRDSDKEVRHVHSRGRVTRNTSGPGYTVLAVTQDITKRVLAEENIRESEGMLRALADAAFDAIFLSEGGVCLDLNRTAERMFGVARSETVGRPLADLVIPDHQNTLEQYVRAEYEGRYEITAQRKDGTTFPCAVQARMIDYQRRRVRYTAFSDISERKRAEEDLRETRLFADNLIQTASVMIVGLDLGGTVTLFNPAGEQITGYSPDELIGRNWFKTVIPPQQRTSMSRRFEKLPYGRMARMYENAILTKGGKERIIAWSNNELRVDGAIVGSISFGVDITERRRTEEQLLLLNRRLAAEQEALIDKNIALKEILDHMDEEKRVFKHQICDSIGKLLGPIIEELEKNGGRLSPRKLAVMRDGLDMILRRDVDDFMGNMQKLSPRELDVCELIRRGLTSKVIATELGISSQTVHKHRQLIRKKLQLNNKSVNLASYLRSRK